MAGDVHTFDLQSMQMIGEQMRFLTTRVRNLQNTVDKATMAGGAMVGDRGRTQDHVQSVVLATGKWLKDSNPNLIADIEADPAEAIAGGLPPYRIQGGYSVSAVAHVMGFNRKTGRQMGTGKKVRIFDPTGNSNLTAGDTAHVFWNRRSNHWEVVGSQSVSSQMVPLELAEDAFFISGSDPQEYAPRAIIKAFNYHGVEFSLRGGVSDYSDVESYGFTTPPLKNMNDPAYEYSYVVDVHGTIPWATRRSRGYGIEIPNPNIELAEDATDFTKEWLPRAKFYYPVFFEQRAMWFGFTAPREISAADRRVVVHLSWMKDWHTDRVQGRGSNPDRHFDGTEGELGTYRGESPKPFNVWPSYGLTEGDVSDETPDPTVAPSAADDGYDTDRANLLAYSTEVYNTFGFTVDKHAPCNAIWMGDRYVLIQARCPVGIKDPTHGSSFDTTPTGGGGISPGQQSTGI